MEKINPSGLLVKSQEYRPFDNKWIDDVVNVLIQQRVQHCKKALDDAMNKNEAYFCNHLNSQYIMYVDENGKEYGHFSAPVYNHMVDFLDGGMPFDRLIIQQALRQYFYNVRYDGFTEDFDKVINMLKNYDKTRSDLENVLTEMMLVL